MFVIQGKIPRPAFTYQNQWKQQNDERDRFKVNNKDSTQ